MAEQLSLLCEQPPPGTVRVKVSAKNMRLRFHPCDPEYIKNVCHSRCCDAPWHPQGILVAIHPKEQAVQEAAVAVGAKVGSDGLLQPREGERLCPFKHKGNHLCTLHFTDHKPAECIWYPFTFNKNGTLIVRNRQKQLVCFKDRGPEDKEPVEAYKAYRTSLVLMFGGAEAERIAAHLDAGGGDLYAYARQSVLTMLGENNERIQAGRAK